MTFLGLAVWAHPHVWVDMGIEVIVEGNRVQGFWVEWSFDEMMTAMVVTDIPPGPNGQFTPAAQQRVFRDYFRNLSNFNYFTYVWWDKVPLPVTRVENFQPSVVNRRLFYRFFVPIGRSLPAAGVELTVSMYDETYWTDMGFRRLRPVQVRGIDPARASWRLQLNPSRAFYGGTVQPEEAIIVLRP